MNVAVIGGGINGIMTAWELLKQGHKVTLYEKDEVMKQTSSASSKLLHGGLRYLENYEFRLVQEALKERQWWIQQAPHLAHPIKLYIPIYKNSRRPAWMYQLGLWLYDKLAGKQNIGKHQGVSKQKIHQVCPELKTDNLIKGFSYYDAQMDDYQLGIWAFQQFKSHKNFTLNQFTTVKTVKEGGGVFFEQNNKKNQQIFDKVINVAGPWAEQLLIQSNIDSEYNLDLVRGSHILVEKEIGQGYFLEMPNERRIFFVLPYQGKTLIGTTEERQALNDNIQPCEQEIDYLINAYNHYFKTPIIKQSIVQSFAGLRPLIKSASNPNKATREYAIQQNQNLITVFGGKWTTARQLGIKVAGLLK